MRIEFNKFRRDRYEQLKNNIADNLDFYAGKTKNLYIDNEIIPFENLLESLKIDGVAFINIDDNDLKIRRLENWKQNFELGKLLHRKLFETSKNNFGKLIDEKFWAYLAHTNPFKEYIYNRFFASEMSKEDESDDAIDEAQERKIKRYFFSEGGHSSRIGLKFYWHLTYLLYDERKLYEHSEVAFRYIDSVKAIYERNLRKNNLIIKAFVQGIINNDKHIAFRNDKYRTIIPTHINNMAAINLLDAYDYNGLVNKITNEQKILIDQFNQERK